MGTGRRPDVAKKRKEQRESDETVVKCSLLGCLLGDRKKDIVTAIQQRVESCSHRYVRASIALNLMIRKFIDDTEELTTTVFPEFWESTFVRQLMLGTKSAQQKDPWIQHIYEEFPTLLSSKKRYLGDRNIYSFAATKLSTNIKNHLRYNLEKLVKTYFYESSGLTKEQASEAVKTLFRWIKTDSTDPKVLLHVNKIRGFLETSYITKQFLKSEAKLSNILKLFIFLNREFETKKLKVYNLLPLCKVRNHYITIDTSVFQGILKDVGIIQNDSKDLLDHELWDSVFNTSKLKGRNKVFTRTIDTDGCVVNVHFRKPKKKEASNELCLKGKRVLGVDPGRTNIFSIVEETSPNQFQQYSLSRRHYYHASGINVANFKSQHWNRSLKTELKLLSQYSPKSASLEKFQAYMEAFFTVEENLWSEYSKSKWSEQRFRLYGGKKRVFAKFFNTLGDNVVLAYGSAKLTPGGRNEVSVPVGKAYKEATYRFPTIPIDEFRTSKVNWKDHTVLDLVKKPNDKGKLVQVRGLLWCRSTIESKGKFIDRDLNAAINILRCVTMPRPTILKRSLVKSKLTQSVGKIIHC